MGNSTAKIKRDTSRRAQAGNDDESVELSPDQLRIVTLLPGCRTHLLLARETRMSLSSVKRHLAEIRDQLGAENDSGAVVEALRNCLIRLEDLPPPPAKKMSRSAHKIEPIGSSQTR